MCILLVQNNFFPVSQFKKNFANKICWFGIRDWWNYLMNNTLTMLTPRADKSSSIVSKSAIKVCDSSACLRSRKTKIFFTEKKIFFYHMSHRNCFVFFCLSKICSGKQLLLKDLLQENFRIIKPKQENWKLFNNFSSSLKICKTVLVWNSFCESDGIL